MRTLIPPPGVPEFWSTWTPAVLPWSAASTPATGMFRSSSALTEDVEDARFRRASSPYPITTTSSMVSADVASTTSIRERPATSTVCVSKPMYENTRVASADGRDSE